MKGSRAVVQMFSEGDIGVLPPGNTHRKKC